ncbi:hypothetical protein DV467_07020 [Enterococcus faecium]|nr:hypothetical protein EGW42_08305 [Enterococcus faecium]ROY01972.1 hypothetical protein EGW48_08020 [Enterococcus faecium]ROZ27411.1 hypothetical protein EGX18_09390 [Enterococcus faecium]RXW65760.1 hypothetical protein CYQ71_07585 [Enterococcus faecium]TKQ56776.1 hypothetical protein DV456_07200 [Enterococcus faecium]
MLRPQRFAYNLSYTHTKRIWRTNPLKNPRIDFLDDFFTLMILPKQFCPYFILLFVKLSETKLSIYVTQKNF